jgi:hypothetical protein
VEARSERQKCWTEAKQQRQLRLVKNSPTPKSFTQMRRKGSDLEEGQPKHKVKWGWDLRTKLKIYFMKTE